MNFLLFLLGTFGLTFLLKESGLLHRPRLWLISLHPLIAELLDCWFCSGFWAALLAYFILHPFLPTSPAFILWAFAGASSTYLLASLVLHQESN